MDRVLALSVIIWTVDTIAIDTLVLDAVKDHGGLSFNIVVLVVTANTKFV